MATLIRYFDTDESGEPVLERVLAEIRIQAPLPEADVILGELANAMRVAV